MVTAKSPAVSVWRPWLGRALGWLGYVAALAPFAIMLIGGALFDMDKPAHWGEIIGLLWGSGFFAGALGAVFSQTGRQRASLVKADTAGLEVTPERGAAFTIARDDIRQAAVVTDWGRPGVALDLKGGRSVVVRANNVEEAQRLYAALGIEQEKLRYRMALHPSFMRPAGGCLSLGAIFAASVAIFEPVKKGMSGTFGGFLWLGIVITIFSLFMLFTSRPEIEVGVDGVAVRELGRTRFVPFRDLKSIRARERKVELEYADGRVERVNLRQASIEQITALDDRLSRAFAASRGEDIGAASPLSRDGRSLEAWRAHLGELLSKSDGYRDAAFTPERAQAVLAAGDATPEHRLGAALALATADPEGAKARLRIAADGCANPRLRVALSSLAQGELDEAAALEALEAEREEQRATAT